MSGGVDLDPITTGDAAELAAMRPYCTVRLVQTGGIGRARLVVTAPFNGLMDDGASRDNICTRTWVLLYAHVNRLPGVQSRPLLLGRVPAHCQVEGAVADFPMRAIHVALDALSLSRATPLSVVAIEVAAADSDLSSRQIGEFVDRHVVRRSRPTPVADASSC